MRCSTLVVCLMVALTILVTKANSQSCPENCAQMYSGNCKQLTCDAQRCTQTCQNGGSTMECTDKADQTCFTGNCTNICKAKDVENCNQKCFGAGCTFVGPPRNRTTCDKPILQPYICLQSGCPYKDCHMVCSKKTITQKNCFQYCYPPGFMCPQSMACDTEKCLQTCVGNCKKAECSAAEVCRQLCSGECKTSRCTSKVCNQTCSDGSCDTLECSDGTERCIQNCNAATCSNLTSKASKEEIQFCRGGNCESLKCNSQNCTQKCSGNCAKMVCTGALCNQECLGESCEMHCSKSVKSCSQTCKTGKCKLLCEAESCKRICTAAAECTDVNRNSAVTLSLHTSLLFNGLLFVFITLMH